MSLSVPNAHLIGGWFQLLGAGAYFVIFTRCVRVLWEKKRRGGDLSVWLVTVNILIFMIITLNAVTEMVRSYSAFGVNETTPRDPVKFFADAATSLSLLKNSCITVITIIADAIMVYRTYVVWGSRYWAVAIPAGLFLADLATGIWSTWSLSQTRTGENLILAAVSVRVQYFYIVTLCLNVLCAAMISWQIWRVHTAVPRGSVVGAVKTTKVIEVVTESAAMYCAVLVALIICISMKSNVMFIFLDSLPPIMGIVFSLVIVRAATSSDFPTVTESSNGKFGLSFLRNQRSMTSTGLSRGVEIDLERVVHSDADSSVPPSHPTPSEYTFGGADKQF